MKVLLRRNITRLGQIGDVVDVRTGYARNYLLPQGLAVVPTEANLKAVEAEKQAYLERLARERAALEARAKALDGKEFTIVARANEEGHLYGSVGPAQIAAEVAAEGIFLEPENILLDAPIRNLDKYEVTVQFAEEVTARITVWVVPPRESEVSGAEASSSEAEQTDDEEEGTSDPDKAPPAE